MSSHSPRHLASLALALALATTSGHAQQQTARLVKDANRAPGEYNTFIHWLLPIGKNVVFPMETYAHGGELWTSDGSPRGTRLLKDIVPGPAGSYPDSPVAFGVNGSDLTRVAFTSPKDTTGNELWVTDATADGTRQLFKSAFPGSFGQLRARAGTTGGVFFENTNWDQSDSNELFFSEGTPDRTWSLNPLVGDRRTNFSDPYGFKTHGAQCFFLANSHEIWSSDGRPEGTRREYSIFPKWPERLAFGSNDRLFVAVGIGHGVSELWTGPMHAGQLTRIDLPEIPNGAWIDELVPFGDEIYFGRVGIDFNRQLWVTDGTTAGTRRILLHGGQQDEPRSIGSLTPWKGTLYFGTYSDGNNSSLWRLNDAQSAPQLITSFGGSKGDLDFFETLATDDFLYFKTLGPDGHNQLWRTKGDPASTRPVKGTPSVPNSTGSPQLAATPAGIFFNAGRNKPEEALWRLRGKTNGAIRLTTPEKKTAWGIPPYPTADALPYETFGGKLLSFVNVSPTPELWRMNPDGTGTRSIWKAPAGYHELGFQATTTHGAIFTDFGGTNLNQVWVTDGTAKGTRLLRDHDLATDQGYPYDFVKLGDTCFYSVINQDPAQSSLWRTDGTPESTMKIVAAGGIAPAPIPDAMVIFQDALYFLATGPDGKGGLWRTDGTQAGTVLVTSAMSADGSEMLADLSVAGGELLFKVTLANFVDILWHSDGTAAGTSAVDSTGFGTETLSHAVDLDGVAIFHARRWPQLSLHWWRHDATGTTPLQDDLTDTHFHFWHPHTRTIATAGGLLFYGGIQNQDMELWVTNGTDAGTRRVKDINPGAAISAPQEMLTVGGIVYFSAEHHDYGRELWRSDGTEAGTYLLADIEPGPYASSPKGLKAMNGKLYFNAERRDIGRELFSIELPE